MGLAWSETPPLTSAEVRTAPRGAGLYRIIGLVGGEVLYIGESGNLASRLRSHAVKDWGGMAAFSCVEMAARTLAYQRHEWENDLVAGFFESTGKPPRFQLVNGGMSDQPAAE
jgi:hypothetical protein